MRLRLVTLGGLRGILDDAEIDWLGSKWLLSGLLTYLTLERQATRDTLMATFWPDSDTETAAHRLSQTVYALRRALGEACIETKGQDLRAGSRLTADALEMEAAVSAGRHDDAVRLYAGPFLVGVHLIDTTGFEGWVDARRARYARLFRVACRAQVDSLVAAGRHSDALATAHAWIAPDPIDDEAQHRLIELLSLVGERQQALRQYEAYSKLLEADGLEPLDQTRALVASIESETTVGALIPRFEAGAARPQESEAPPSLVSAARLDGQRVAQPATVGPRRGIRGRRWAVIVPVAVVAVGGLWAGMATRSARDLPARSIGLGFLMDPATGTDAERAWTTAFEASVTGHLADIPGLRVIATQNVTALGAAGLSPDSIASELEADYLVRVTAVNGGDSAVATLTLMDGGLRIDRRITIRGSVRDDPLADRFGRNAAESLRDMLGSRVRERLTGIGTRDERAVRLRYRARQYRVLAAEALRSGFSELAGSHLDRADSLLAESHRRDRNWALPALERASLVELRRAQIGSSSGANGVDRIIAAFDTAIQRATERLARSPDHAGALALRGRLRWLRADVDTVDPGAAVDAAVHDIERALAEDELLASAAVDLSDILFASGDYPGALHWARSADHNDTWLQSQSSIPDRIALSHFELMRDDSARHWCREGLRREPDNPSPWGCLLEVMAWGTGEADPDSAAAYYRAIAERALPVQVPQLRTYYGIAVAGVLARAGLADSARAMLAAARPDWADETTQATINPRLLGLESAVLFRLGQSDSARHRFDEYRRIDPRRSGSDASKRLLRAFVSARTDRPGS